VFYAGDDEHALDEFRRFAGNLGFAPVAVGNLRDGGRLMQLGGSLSGVQTPSAPGRIRTCDTGFRRACKLT